MNKSGSFWWRTQDGTAEQKQASRVALSMVREAAPLPQLRIWLETADGDETILKVHRLTQRFLSMVWVIKQFVPIHITVKGQEGNPGTVTIRWSGKSCS